LRPPQNWQSWPAHIKYQSGEKKCVQHLKLELIINDMNEHERRQFNEFYNFFRPESLRRLTPESTTRIDMQVAEILQYLEAGVFKRFDGSKHLTRQPLGMHFYFLAEVAKSRKRLIQHTVDINSQTTNPDGLIFEENAERIYRGLLGAGFVADGSWFYQQIPLPPGSEEYYAFLTPLGWLTLSSIATGQRQAVGAAHLIANFINRRVSDLMRAFYVHHDAEAVALRSTSEYIDNFRRREKNVVEATAAAKLFCRVCSFYNITLNESAHQILQQATVNSPYEFIGVLYDPQSKKAGLTSKTKRKLQQLQLDIGELALSRASWSMEFANSVFGLLIFGSAVLRLSTSPWYYVYKFFRRRHADKRQPGEDADVWPCIFVDLADWCSTLLRTEMVDWSRTTPRSLEDVPILISDASESGYGATLFHRGEVRFVGAAWPEGTFVGDNMNELETLAVDLSARHFQLTSFNLIVDNTTTLFSIRKGRSRSYRVNLLIHQLTSKYNILSAGYINTKWNISDSWSRIFDKKKEPTASPPPREACSERDGTGKAKPGVETPIV
jgi:hypothetical protein